MKRFLAIPFTLFFAAPAFAQASLNLGTTGIQGFDNLINLAVRLLQVIFLLGGFAYLGFAGLTKSKGAMDANDRLRDAAVGAAVAIGAPILLEVIKQAMGV